MRVHCPVRLYLALVDCVGSTPDLAEHFRSTPAGSGELCKCPTFTALSQLHLTGFLPACQNNRYVSKKTKPNFCFAHLEVFHLSSDLTETKYKAGFVASRLRSSCQDF